jgi:regulatory protein
MKIVKAKRSGRNRVEILLDNDQKITLAYEVFLKNQLKLNQEVSEELLSFLLKEDQSYLVKQSALNYLARRQHSKNEIRTKLRQKKFSLELIEQTLNELEQNNYINDLSFARIFTDEMIKAKNWGKNKIKSELIKRGVSSKIITEVIEEKFSGDSEIESGLELARKKLKKLINRKVDQKKIQSSIYSFLVSRGYDYELCKQIFSKLFEGDELSDF